MLRWLHDDDCGVALDTRHEPVLFTTWYGSATCALIDDYFRWWDATSAAAMATEQRLIHVIDLRRAERASALVRKRMLEHSRDEPAAHVRLATIAVADPGMASQVHVAARMGRRPHAPNVVETIEEAIELALIELRSAKIPAPPGLSPERYQAPTLASVR
jgi:hypothetical protein